MAGHYEQATDIGRKADLYRTFDRKSCYALQIEVSVSDESEAPKTPQSTSLAAVKAHNARESLKLTLSPVVFER